MDPVLVVIIACEIGFWILVVLGLAARYIMRWRRAGAVLLATTPVIDLVLLAAVVINLQAGGTASFFHGLAALYLGVSIVYGRILIKWADVRFAHRFAHGLAPRRRDGREYMKECWQDVARTTVAIGIAAGILWLLTALVDDPSRIQALRGVYPILGIWFTIDVVWAISYTISPKS